MSKQSTNIALLCASLLLGFTQASFAADTDPALMNIPPPPILRGPMAESGPAAYGANNMGGSTNVNPNSAAALVGTSRAIGPMSATAPSSTVPKSNSPNASLFAKDNSNAAATQSATASAVNAATQEAARQAALANAAPATLTWGFQQFPAANTMYSNPQRK